METLSQPVSTPVLSDSDLLKLADLPPDHLKQYIQTLKDKYDQLKNYNNELNGKLHRQLKREQRMREEQKQAVLQAETVNMMTKYQLVFVKMENQFAKIFNSNKLRNLKHKQEAFQRIKVKALTSNVQINFKTHSIYEKFRNKIMTSLINRYQKNQQKKVQVVFQKWQEQAVMPRIIRQVEESANKELQTLKQKLNQKEKEAAEKETLIKQKEQQFKQLMTELRKYNQRIDEQEQKERQLGQEIQALIYKNTTNAVENQKGVSSVFSRAQMLEQSLQQLKRENKSLREKLEMTELNMQSFIREMGGLIDQHDLSEAFSEIMAADQYLNPGTSSRTKPEEEGGGSTGGSIRRNK